MKRKIHTAIMQRMAVINDNGDHVGYGYILVLDNGMMTSSELVDKKGDMLPVGEYALLRTGNDSLVVLTEVVQ